MKAKTAPPFLIASLRPASSDDSEALMASKAAEEGKASVVLSAAASGRLIGGCGPFLRDIVCCAGDGAAGVRAEGWRWGTERC